MTLQTAFHTVGAKINAYSPEILTGVAIAANIGAMIFASRATLRLQDHLDSLNENKEILQNGVGKKVHLSDDTEVDYTEEMHKNDMMVLYRDTIVKIFRDYLPAGALAVGSIALMISSNNIHAERNAGMAAAYSALAGAFAAYRKRVTDAEGSEKDKEYLHGVKKEIVTEVDEKGKKHKVEKLTKDDGPYSPYAKLFSTMNPNWKENPINNLTFLEAQERILNDRLIVQGYLFLNDVYDALGFSRTQAGNMVGWVYNPKDPNRENVIDFGLYHLTGDAEADERRADFVNGHEDSVMLDFNVDGPIYEILRQF